MTDDDLQNSITPQPQVTVAPIKRTDPVLEEVVEEIKEIIKVEGFCTLQSYLACSQKYQVTDEVLLPVLQQAGLGFVKTSAVDPELPQEVIVDLRYISAAMLLIYSEQDYALHHSVLNCLTQFHDCGVQTSLFSINSLGNLLQEIYTAYGHHFSDMDMADRADFSSGKKDRTSAVIARHIHSLNELVRNDLELTAVYHLCIEVMFLVNNDQTHAKMRLGYKNMPKAFHHFWRMACKIRDRGTARSIRRQINKSAAVHSCGDANCNHIH